jgi:hypothetical protein
MSQEFGTGADRRTLRLDGTQDPAELAVALRTLAIRAHRAVKAVGQTVDANVLEELRDLRTAVCWLEETFLSRQMHRMVPYVAALRLQIEAAIE